MPDLKNNSGKFKLKTNSKKNQIKFAEKCQSCSGFEEKLQPSQLNLANELAEMDKHELLCSIATSFGKDPAFFNIAEEIFDRVKYQISEYVLKHEYNRENRLSVDLTLWLEQRKKPMAARSLDTLIHTYLKPQKPA